MGTISPNNLGSFCSILARGFIHGLRDTIKQRSTLTRTFTLCWCYPQHKSEHFHSAQKGEAEYISQRVYKMNGMRKRKVLIFSSKSSISLSFQSKFYFFSVILVVFDIVDNCLRFSWPYIMYFWTTQTVPFRSHVNHSFRNIPHVLWTNNC